MLPALPSKATLVDLFERTLATFAQAFLAILIVNQGHLSQITALETAGVAGGLAVAKFLLMKANTFLGSPAQAAVQAPAVVKVATKPTEIA